MIILPSATARPEWRSTRRYAPGLRHPSSTPHANSPDSRTTIIPHSRPCPDWLQLPTETNSTPKPLNTLAMPRPRMPAAKPTLYRL